MCWSHKWGTCFRLQCSVKLAIIWRKDSVWLSILTFKTYFISYACAMHAAHFLCIIYTIGQFWFDYWQFAMAMIIHFRTFRAKYCALTNHFEVVYIIILKIISLSLSIWASCCFEASRSLQLTRPYNFLMIRLLDFITLLVKRISFVRILHTSWLVIRWIRWRKILIIYWYTIPSHKWLKIFTCCQILLSPSHCCFG